MHISREENLPNAIMAYDDFQIKVNDTIYKQSVVITGDTILSPWEHQEQELSAYTFEPILTLNPEVIILGYSHQPVRIETTTLIELSKKGIGVETMALGAACRTFNVLLQEGRDVVAALILNAKTA